MKRRPFLLLCATSLLAGCSSWNLFSPSKPKAPGETAGRPAPYGRRPGRALRHVPGEGRGRGPGLRPARHGQRPRALAATGDAHGRNAAARRGKSQSTAGHAQFFAGDRPRLPAAGHPEGRPFRRRIAGQRSQRNHQPPRRLPAGNPLVGHGRDLRQTAGRQGPRRRPGAGAGRSFGHGETQQRAVGPRRRAGRRRCPRVAFGRPVPQRRRRDEHDAGATPQCGREKRPGGQRHQSPLQHAQARNQRGSRPGDPRQLRRSGRRSGLQGQSGAVFPGVAGDRAAGNVGRD